MRQPLCDIRAGGAFIDCSSYSGDGSLVAMSFRTILLPVVLLAVSASAQTAAKIIEPSGTAKAPNAQQVYAALRADLPGTDGVSVKDFTLEREGGTFHFDQGDFYFYTPVEGKVTGAVFVGKGQFTLKVKDAAEERSLERTNQKGGQKRDI